MARTRDPALQAPPAELPKARPGRWWSIFLVASLATLALILLPNSVIPTWLRGVWITPVRPALIGIMILIALYAHYRARIEWDALNGLRVDVQDFTGSRAAGSGPSLKELTAGFKKKLNTSRIYNPASLPGTAASQDFLQLVENAVDAAPGWWKVAARLLRLLRPPAAYRVSGTVVDSDRPGMYKLVVELVRLPRSAANPLVLEDDHWERLLEQAANSVAAQIFPRSNKCRQQPQWYEWWGYQFPPELFDAYQQAHKYQSKREYDRALWEFYRALRADPSNVYIRLEIAQLQERLDLHLDALVTYDDVITICSSDDPELATWWNVPSDSGQKWPEPRPHRRLALLVARNRHALMLGHGDRIAEQWWLHPDKRNHEAKRNERQRQRDALRAIVSLRFARYRFLDNLWPAGDGHWHSAEVILDTDPSVRKEGEERQALAKALRVYLCTLAQYEFERLEADYPRYQKMPRIARDQSDLVTARGLRLVLVWAMLRRAMALAEVHLPIVSPGAVWRQPDWLPPSNELFPATSWPPRHEALRGVISTLGQGEMIWHEHYNLACVCSVPLLHEVGLPRKDAQAFRRLAVDHLHRAAAVSHSGFLAQRRTWLLHEDPDLASLRGTPEFRNFELITFARHRLASPRPHDVHRWELVCYQANLVKCLAEAMAERWRRRGLEPSAESSAQRQAMEQDAWRHVARLAISCRDWRVRYDAIGPLLRWRKEVGLPFAEIGLPEYSQRDLYVRYGNAVTQREADGEPNIKLVNTLVRTYVERCGKRMSDLAAELRRTNGAGGPDQTGSLPIARLDRSASTAESRWRAELWAALTAWFDDESGGDRYADRLARFQRTLDQVASRRARRNGSMLPPLSTATVLPAGRVSARWR